MDKSKFNLEFPVLGQRIIRTVVGVALCYTILSFGDRQNVFIAALAVLQCIQPYMKNSFEMARQRLFGTIIGGGWALIAIYGDYHIDAINLMGNLTGNIIVAILAGAVLYTAVVFHVKDSAGFAAVVFLGVLAFPLVDQNPILFVGERLAFTMAGVVIAIIVNAFHLPRDRNANILFVSDIDHIMAGGSDIEILPHNKVELNHLIERGAQFTMATWRTPASLMNVTEGIDLKLPVVVMNGAAIFDMENNAYIETCPMSYEQATKIMKFLDKYNFNYFINVVVDDALLIYYEQVNNEAEVGMYNDDKISPLRNYIQRQLPEGESVIYIIVIDETDKIDKAYSDLSNQEWANEYRIEAHVNDEYPDYKILRIYHKNANHKEMLEKIRAKLDLEKTLTIGSRKQNSDIVVENADVDLLVKNVRSRFEPVNFSLKNIFRK